MSPGIFSSRARACRGLLLAFGLFAHGLAAANISGADKLQQLLSPGLPSGDFLEVDQAFHLDAFVRADKIVAAFSIADGYYLYRDKISFRASGAAQIGDYALPPGEQKHDPYFGESAVLTQDFRTPIVLLRASPAPGEVRFEASYQGCAEKGICYAPVKKTFALALPAASDDAAFSLPTSRASAFLPLGAFVAGIALAFTPCVLPLLPILAGVIAGGGKPSGMRGGMLAAIYVLGTGLTYAVIGGVAGASGEQLQAYFQNPWAIGGLSAILVLMALSLFGLFEMQTPSALQTWLREKTARPGGKPVFVFLLGLGSALVVGVCVSPLLISFLSVAIARGDAMLGAILMASLALGMGMPLIVFGFGLGRFLPASGAWMRRINPALGVMLIGVALWLLQGLPAVPVLLLWGAALILLGVYLLMQRTGGEVWRWLGKGVGVIVLVWGGAAMLGGFVGERDILRPLPAFNDARAPHAAFIKTQTLAQIETQMARAARENKHVMMDFRADWCVDCLRMEATTFRDAEVTARMAERFIALSVDLTDPRDANARAIKKRFGVFGPPAMLFFAPDGAPIDALHFYGYRDAEALLGLFARL